ncbi:MAG: hypothetical protein DCC67_17875 [Planctomycetota bacterium]|nr:MAG: hypothetical protein DCC67_17875 [Planctomycetota bacterium]
MPSSRNNHIPTVLSVVQQLKPQSILDIGTGFGKWGFLFREYTDIVASEHDPARYQRANWRVVIDGIEGFRDYLTPVHSYVYNSVFVGDLREILPTLGQYVRECISHATKAVIISTPAEFVPQGEACGNSYEIHRSFWSPGDFMIDGADCLAEKLENEILLAVLLKPGMRKPAIRPARRKRSAKQSLWRRVLRRLVKEPAKQLKTTLTRSTRRFNATSYWERRYAAGGNSGLGSYGELAQFKAQVVNRFIAERGIRTVVEFGAGDGNQLSLLRCPEYVGVDVSATAIDILSKKFATDRSKLFCLSEEFDRSRQFDLALSLDVLYHLVDDGDYCRYMRDLFNASNRFVVIYSSNEDRKQRVPHVRDRRFTTMVENLFPGWRLVGTVENPYKSESRADFYFYERTTPAGTSVASHRETMPC